MLIKGNKYEQKTILDQKEINRIESRIKMCDSIIKENPENSRSYYSKALKLIELGKNIEALEYLNTAIEKNSNRPIYYAKKAKIHAEANWMEQAKEALKQINVEQLGKTLEDRCTQDIIKKLQNKYPELADIATYEDKNLVHLNKTVVHENEQLYEKFEDRLTKLEEQVRKLTKFIQDQQQKSNNYVSKIENHDNNHLTLNSDHNDESVKHLGDGVQ